MTQEDLQQIVRRRIALTIDAVHRGIQNPSEPTGSVPITQYILQIRTSRRKPLIIDSSLLRVASGNRFNETINGLTKLQIAHFNSATENRK